MQTAKGLWGNKRFRLLAGGVVVVLAVVLLAPMFYTFISTRGNRYNLDHVAVQDIAKAWVAIVLEPVFMKTERPRRICAGG